MKFYSAASPGHRMLESPATETLVDLSTRQLHLVLNIAQPPARHEMPPASHNAEDTDQSQTDGAEQQ
jgi:hypothetical protein